MTAISAKRRKRKTEIRLNDDGTLDEIVGCGFFHLEQLNDNEWYLGLGEMQLWIGARRGKCYVNYETNKEPHDKLTRSQIVARLEKKGR